jgi:DNA-directed RNA polymerase beta' subunit
MATKLKQASIAIRQNRGKDLSPRWDDVDGLTGEQFGAKYRDAMKWYRLETSAKDLKPKVIDWMGRAGMSKSEIAEFKKTKDWRCNLTMGSIAACLIKGMPDNHPDWNKGRSFSDYLKKSIKEVVEAGKHDIEEVEEVKAVKTTAPVVTIQDRLKDAAGDMGEEIDYAIDSWIMDPDAFDPKAFKMANLLRGKGAKAAHARFIKAYFKRGHDELLELASGQADEQLREGYSHVSRKNVKKLIDFYESIMTACDQIAAEAKLNKKPRAKKQVPADKLVAKLKFKASDDKLGLTSVPPAQLVGAQGAVVYNTKTRKIGIYTSLNSNGLTVKGTTIGNFTDKSMQKTLRKPEVQLREFKDQNTQKRIETWVKNIKATEVPLNGRINADIMILKVFK